MKTTITLNQSDITAAICELFKSKGQAVKHVHFKVEETGDCFDRPTGHSVFVEVEVDAPPLLVVRCNPPGGIDVSAESNANSADQASKRSG